MMRKLPEEGIVKLLIHCLIEAPCTHTHIHENPHCTHQSENPSALGKKHQVCTQILCLVLAIKIYTGGKKSKTELYPNQIPWIFHSVVEVYHTPHTLGSVAEELSIPFWVGPTCALPFAV